MALEPIGSGRKRYRQVNVPYEGSQTLEKILASTNLYHSVDSRITDSNFRSGKLIAGRAVQTLLFIQDKPHWRDELVEELERHHCIGMDTATLLRLGIMYPHLMHDLPLIVALEPSIPFPHGNERWPVRLAACIGGNTNGWRGAHTVLYEGPYAQHVVVGGILAD